MLVLFTFLRFDGSKTLLESALDSTLLFSLFVFVPLLVDMHLRDHLEHFLQEEELNGLQTAKIKEYGLINQFMQSVLRDPLRVTGHHNDQ